MLMCVHLFFFFFFFFFQAEDGIRDLTVTGVQTCALPISRLDRGRARTRRPADRLARRELLYPRRHEGRSGRAAGPREPCAPRSEEHTSELQSQSNLVCRLLLEKKKQESASDRL